MSVVVCASNGSGTGAGTGRGKAGTGTGRGGRGEGLGRGWEGGSTGAPRHLVYNEGPYKYSILLLLLRQPVLVRRCLTTVSNSLINNVKQLLGIQNNNVDES